IGCGRRGDLGRTVKIEAGLVPHFLYGVPWMDAAQAEAPPATVEVEEAQLRQQRMRTAGSMDAVVARAGGGDESDLRHPHATAVLLAKEDHAGHVMVEIG